MTEQNDQRSQYWRANLKAVALLLTIWALVSLGFGIVLRPLLAGIKIGGTDLGFWFAQQGSILCFVAIIFAYTVWMNKLDHKFHVDEDEEA